MKKTTLTIVSLAFAAAIAPNLAQAQHRRCMPHRDLYTALDIVNTVANVVDAFNPSPVVVQQSSSVIVQQPVVTPPVVVQQPYVVTTPYVEIVSPVVTTSYYGSTYYYNSLRCLRPTPRCRPFYCHTPRCRPSYRHASHCRPSYRHASHCRPSYRHASHCRPASICRPRYDGPGCGGRRHGCHGR